MKRLKKSTNSVGDDFDNGDTNNRGEGDISSDRREQEQEEDLGSSRSSSARRSGEVGHKNADHGTNNSNSGSRRYAASPSSGTSASHSHRHNNSGDRRRDRDSRGSSSSSRSRSRSRSKSPSERESTPSSATLFDRLKADWGRESWQDFELLQSNVPGPGTKGYNGPGGSQGTLGGKSEYPVLYLWVEP